jgi:N6-adenosine-specific RNA methylase IME4
MCPLSELFAGDCVQIDAFDGEHRPGWANLSHPYTIFNNPIDKSWKGQ